MAGVKTVLVVDDEPGIVQLARDYLENAGFAVLTAADGNSALHTFRTRHPRVPPKSPWKALPHSVTRYSRWMPPMTGC